MRYSDPIWKIFLRFVPCFQCGQHLLFRCKRLPRHWSLMTVIAAVFMIVMASVAVEPTTVRMNGSRCEHHATERK